MVSKQLLFSRWRKTQEAYWALYLGSNSMHHRPYKGKELPLGISKRTQYNVWGTEAGSRSSSKGKFSEESSATCPCEENQNIEVNLLKKNGQSSYWKQKRIYQNQNCTSVRLVRRVPAIKFHNVSQGEK